MNQSEAESVPAPPDDFRALRELIVARRGAMPKRLAQIADFAIAQPQEIAFRTVMEIAGYAGVQPSALVRFAQALGYAGFSDLQAVFRAHARTRWPEYGERLEALRTEPGGGDASAAGLLAGFLRASDISLQRLDASIDHAALERAVDVLAAAETICLVASRRSFPVAAYLAYALRRLGARCDLVDQLAGLAPEQMALVGARDAVLVISFTPYAPSSIELAAAAFRRGVPVVAITDSPFSPLTQAASIWIEVAEADYMAFRSLSATLTLATTLAVAVAKRREASGTVIPT